MSKSHWPSALEKFRTFIGECEKLVFHLVRDPAMLWGFHSMKFKTVANLFGARINRYCKVPVQKALLGDLLPGAVTLVFERSEELNADLNPFTSVSFFFFFLNEITLKKKKTILS